MAMAPASTGAPAGAADPGPIFTLLSQLLGGNYNPTGLGTNPPQALGPNPAVHQLDTSGGAGGGAGSPDMSGVWAALAPFLALLGGGQSNIAGGGNVNVANPAAISDPAQAFLQQILTSLLSPASAAPTAGTAPAPVAAVAPAATPAFLGAPTDTGGQRDTGVSKGGGFDLGGLGSGGPGPGGGVGNQGGMGGGSSTPGGF